MALHPQRLSGRRGLKAVRGLAIALLMSSLAPVAAGAGDAGPDPSSGNLYLQAATREQVPLDVLVAIAGAESGFHPWALNINGQEVYCHSREEAEGRLATDDHIAIGLMQINWRYWGPRLGRTKAELLDPATNLLYGARILKEGLGRSGSIWLRISNYHAGSIAERDKYNRLVYENYRRYLEGETPAERRPAPGGTPRNMARSDTSSVAEGHMSPLSGNGSGASERGLSQAAPAHDFRWWATKRKGLGNVFAFSDAIAGRAPREP